MDPKELRVALGLKEDASDADVDERLTHLRTAFGLKDDASGDEVAALLSKAKAGDGDGGKPADDDKGGKDGDGSGEDAPTLKRLLTLENELALSKAREATSTDIAAGKLLPRQREFAIKLHARDPESYAEFVRSQPEGLIDLSEQGTDGDGKPGDDKSEIVGLSKAEADKIRPSEAELAMAAKFRSITVAELGKSAIVALWRSKAADAGVELPANFDPLPDVKSDGDKSKDGD